MRRASERGHDMAGCCNTEVMLVVAGGKWKILILMYLLRGTHRFGELQRALGPITQRMLTRQLRELEGDGLVRRTVYAQVPPCVEYDLTEIGRSLRPIIEQLDQWGGYYRQQLQGAAGEAPEGEGPSRRSAG